MTNKTRLFMAISLSVLSNVAFSMEKPVDENVNPAVGRKIVFQTPEVAKIGEVPASSLVTPLRFATVRADLTLTQFLLWTGSLALVPGGILCTSAPESRPAPRKLVPLPLPPVLEVDEEDSDDDSAVVAIPSHTPIVLVPSSGQTPLRHFAPITDKVIIGEFDVDCPSPSSMPSGWPTQQSSKKQPHGTKRTGDNEGGPRKKR